MTDYDMPRGFWDFVREVAQQEVREFARSNPLKNAYIPDGGRLRIGTGARIVVDDGGELLIEGDLEVTGNTVIGGTLSLPAGIIDNDALANPVRAAGNSVIQNAIGAATSDQAYASASIPVPAGFSQALVLVNVYAGLSNTSGASDNLYVKARINGVDSREIPIGVTAGAFGGGSTAKSTLLTGLSGGDVTVSVVVHTQLAAWGASAGNRAFTESIVIFLR